MKTQVLVYQYMFDKTWGCEWMGTPKIEINELKCQNKLIVVIGPEPK